ncbi:GM12302 [Drosophila sechellia]|uniref:GM12302 n=1 Tax=Drosophila sechellia TaxID=7238 RepID=B4I155_DROSE|nr:GM12302 [Drosophila sechellia]
MPRLGCDDVAAVLLPLMMLLLLLLRRLVVVVVGHFIIDKQQEQEQEQQQQQQQQQRHRLLAKTKQRTRTRTSADKKDDLCPVCTCSARTPFLWLPPSCRWPKSNADSVPLLLQLPSKVTEWHDGILDGRPATGGSELRRSELT